MENHFDKQLFLKISTYIKKKIYENIFFYHKHKSYIIFNNLNICNDTEDELIFLSKIIHIIKENNIEMNDYKIYIATIYLYYGLVLLEQNDDYLFFNNIFGMIINNHKQRGIYEDIKNLIFEISSSDKEYCSKIRKFLFNMK
jgi:hypothetical protein